MSLLLSLVPTLGISQLLLRFSVSVQKVSELVLVRAPRTQLHCNCNAIIPCKSKLAEKLTGIHPMVMLDAVNIQRQGATPPPQSILNANSVFFCSINAGFAPLMCTRRLRMRWQHALKHICALQEHVHRYTWGQRAGYINAASGECLGSTAQHILCQCPSESGFMAGCGGAR